MDSAASLRQVGVVVGAPPHIIIPEPGSSSPGSESDGVDSSTRAEKQREPDNDSEPSSPLTPMTPPPDQEQHIPKKKGGLSQAFSRLMLPRGNGDGFARLDPSEQDEDDGKQVAYLQDLQKRARESIRLSGAKPASRHSDTIARVSKASLSASGSRRTRSCEQPVPLPPRATASVIEREMKKKW